MDELIDSLDLSGACCLLPAAWIPFLHSSIEVVLVVGWQLWSLLRTCLQPLGTLLYM